MGAKKETTKKGTNLSNHACTSFQCVTPCVTVCFMITIFFVGDTKTGAHNERVYLRSIVMVMGS